MPIAVKLLLSLLLGAFIGLERESYERSFDESQPPPHKKDTRGSLGVRTFALITTLGAVSGLLESDFFSLFLLINVSFMILTIAYYVIGSIFTHDNGITTELAIIIAYLIGLVIALEALPIQIVIALTVLMVLILSQKQNLREIVKGIRHAQVRSFISYAIIALVILPFIPNQSYRLADIPVIIELTRIYNFPLGGLAQIEFFNPFKLWFIVALITGVEVLGYILEKTIGQKQGWLLTSAAGGFISSTSVTQSLAQKSNKSTSINQLVAAAIVANLAPFFQLVMLIAPINGQLLVQATKFVFAIIISSLITIIFFLVQKQTKTDELAETKNELASSEIFSLKPALKFAMLFLVISVVTKVALFFFGQGGFMLSSSLAAVTGLDAVILNLSNLAGSAISFQTAILTLIIANTINLTSKTIYSFVQGKREFAVKFGLSMLFVVLTSFVGLI